MKVLVLDHHFTQDIDALMRKAPGDVCVRSVSPIVLASEAARLFPPKVFDSDLSVFYDAAFENERATLRTVAREIVFDIYRIFPFDVFISPSDTFFYIRDAIDACGELGIPFVVIQKEAGVSAKSLHDHAPEMRRWFPFKGDWMTTCSGRSADFWVECGASRDRISIIGQPRFDFYRDPSQWASMRDLSIDVDSRKKVLLFLSYDLNAYDENRALGSAHKPWERLHAETEAVLKEAADAGTHTILIKPHPQHSAAELSALRERYAGRSDIRVIDPRLDTRQLIVNSDIIVGFQTTALAEAMAAGKRVVYTFWTDRVERARDLLLPFHELQGALTVADSPVSLRRAIDASGSAASEFENGEVRERFLNDYLGLIDGSSSVRAWRVIESRVHEASAIISPAQAVLRAQLQRGTIDYAKRELRIAKRRRFVRSAGARVASLFGNIGRSIRDRLLTATAAEDTRITECREAISGKYRSFGYLIGPHKEPLILSAYRFIGYRLPRWTV